MCKNESMEGLYMETTGKDGKCKIISLKFQWPWIPVDYNDLSLEVSLAEL